MKGIVTNIRLSVIGDRQWASITIDHGISIPDSQMTIPARESGEWVLGTMVELMAHDPLPERCVIAIVNTDTGRARIVRSPGTADTVQMA